MTTLCLSESMAVQELGLFEHISACNTFTHSLAVELFP